ncbi:MAG: ATP-binding cassette domain-containing protein [Bacteroidota bacterium]
MALSIQLERVYKRFDREWIIKDFSYHFQTGAPYGIWGPNGSGKSTLLRLISGHLSASRGRIEFRFNQQNLAASSLYPYLSICAPYIDPIEELSLTEAIQFHFRFKKLRAGLDLSVLPQVFQLDGHQQRRIASFSSGMRQRVQLGLAICSDTPLLLLDEPSVTLDENGRDWLQSLLRQQRDDRLVIIASNERSDLAQCGTIIEI